MLDANELKLDPDAARAFGDQLWTELHNTILPMVTDITSQVEGSRQAGLGSSGHGYAGPRFTATHDSSAGALTKWLTDLQVGISSLAIGAVVTSQLLQDSDLDTAEGTRDVIKANDIVSNYTSGREGDRHE